MPRVQHVKSARKAWPPDIEIGDSYYWWKFAFGPRYNSKTYPKRSRLTQSGFLSQLWDLEDGLSDRLNGLTKDDLEDELENITAEIQELHDECEQNRENMPEHLQDVGSGEILQERMDAMEEWIDEIEGIDLDPQEGCTWEDVVDEILNTSCGL